MEDLRAGICLGDRYLVDDKSLGEGAFGAVMRATDTKDGKDTKYAIKKVLIDDLVLKKMERHIKNEISIMRIIAHPNIVNLQDVFYSKHNLYLVLELATGGDVFDLLSPEEGSGEEGGPLNEADCRKYFQQLICAVEYCHSKGIAHRDIKPENLLLDANKNLKICDFGLSTLKSNGGPTQTQCGTPNYVAPEVLHTDGIYSNEYDPMAADVWTCGVILYVFATACLPFDHQNDSKLYELIKKAKFMWPQGCTFSQSGRELVSRILNPNPGYPGADPDKCRPSIAKIKDHPWFKGGSKGPILIPGKENDFSEHPAPVSSPKSTAKEMNAFELLSRIDSMAGMGGRTMGKGDRMRFTAKKNTDTMKGLLKAAIEAKSCRCHMEESTLHCEGVYQGSKLEFVVEACPVIDEVSVVNFSLSKGNPEKMYNFFCEIAQTQKDNIQGAVPLARSQSC